MAGLARAGHNCLRRGDRRRGDRVRWRRCYPRGHRSLRPELYTLYLLKESQGRGVGKALLGAVMQALGEKGYASMLVWVLQENPAVQFYQEWVLNA